MPSRSSVLRAGESRSSRALESVRDGREVVPVLRVDDATRAVKWYVRLGFVKDERR
jgi:hypothetical protein